MTSGKQRGKGFTIAVALAALALGFVLVAALMRSYNSGRDGVVAGGAADPARAAQQSEPPVRQAEPAQRTTQGGGGTGNGNVSPFEQIFGEGQPPAQPALGETGDWLMTFAIVTVRLALAALLSAVLAFRPRRLAPSVKRNPFVAQTQILMAVVASALMMVVGDSAARAFGIFAAASLVRFRTNIKDPKEITVLLVSLAIGLATGVGRWELGLILAVFVLLLLWGLEYREQEQVTRAMELTVRTRNIGTTQDALLQLFKHHNIAAEMRTIDRPNGEGEAGCVVYHVNVAPRVSTDLMSEELLTSDPKNIDGVEWAQQKNTSYFYQ